MRIERVEAIPVSVPRAAPFASALGIQESTDHGIVRVTTDSGVVGLGEISLIWHGDGSGLCDEINRRVGPALIGADPFEITRLNKLLRKQFEFGKHSLTAAAAIEMAILDIQGKVLGQSVTSLLGGAMRDKIELSMSISLSTPDQAVEQAHSYVEQGFRTVKVKVGGMIKDDLATVAAIRTTFGDQIKIRGDANMAWATAKEALAGIRQFEQLGMLSIEQPLPASDIAGMAYLREHCEIPIIADESVWSPDDAWQVISNEAADILNVYVAEAGGILAARQIADLTALAGVGFCIGSMPELGVGWAAAAHLGFVVSHIDHPSDIAGVLYQRQTLIEQQPDIRDGFLYPLEGPGLGVSIDEDQLEAFRTDGSNK